MVAFLSRRLAGALVLVLAVSSVCYGLIFSGGQHIARDILGDIATEQQVAELASRLGLDRPLWVQYLDWLTGAIQGNLGESFFSSTSVIHLLATRLPVTLSIVTLCIALATLISLALGVTAALQRGWVDRAVQLLAVLAESLPNFWLALVLVAVFAINLSWLPATGYVPLTESVPGWLATVALPVIALAMGSIASGAQQIRSAVIAILHQDYVRTLRARGLPEATILSRNILRNAAPPVLTVLSLQFIAMMGGSFVIERVFALPGIGTLAVDATISGDIPVVMGVLLVTTVIVVTTTVLVDLLIAAINPKVRLQ